MTDKVFLCAPVAFEADDAGRLGSDMVMAALLAERELTAAVLAR
jgi:hypothetical protein